MIKIRRDLDGRTKEVDSYTYFRHKQYENIYKNWTIISAPQYVFMYRGFGDKKTEVGKIEVSDALKLMNRDNKYHYEKIPDKQIEITEAVEENKIEPLPEAEEKIKEPDIQLEDLEKYFSNSQEKNLPNKKYAIIPPINPKKILIKILTWIFSIATALLIAYIIFKSGWNK